MKKVAILFFFVIVLFGCSRYPRRSDSSPFLLDLHTTTQPFQVIHSDGVYNLRVRTDLSRFQLLSLADTLQLADSSYLLLAHHSGLFLEFEGDTVLNVSQLAEHVAHQLNILPNVKKTRAIIRLLFSDTRNRNYPTGAVLRCVSYPIEFILPISTTSDISANKPEICLSWETRDGNQHKEFVVQIKNIFDELIGEYEVGLSETSLDLSKYSIDNRLLIVNVSDRNDSTFRSPDIGVKIGREYVYAPKLCELYSAAAALEIGFHMESNGYSFDAAKYYKLAAELSDRSIYSEVLTHHRRRN